MTAMRVIDLRSDTVTKPTPAMRRAMADAEVGDDFYGDDPTVRKLEDRAAEILRKPAAMLVLSGTMGNLLSLLSWGQRGQSVLLSTSSHIFLNEAGNIAALAGLLPIAVPAPSGSITREQLLASLRPSSVLAAPLALVCIENTHNAAGGRCIGVSETSALCRLAHDHGLRTHLDGARLFNAAVALRVPAAELVAPLDSVTFCLTKGLGCPVGSLLVGDSDFIAQARRWRQMIGGGMRQAGAFAAAGLVALDTMIERLAEDHANARRLAAMLADLGVTLDPPDVETNIVFVEAPDSIDADAFAAAVVGAGVRINPPKGRRLRFVVHADVSATDIDEAGARMARVLHDFR